MEVDPYEKDYYFAQCDPIVKNSLSPEQAREIERLLELSMKCSNQGATKINFNIWFFHLYFITLSFGKEQRSATRRLKEYRKVEAFLSIISTIFSFVFTLGIIFAIFLALYHIKSYAGIDLFEGSHLGDFLKWSNYENIDGNQLLSTLFYRRV